MDTTNKTTVKSYMVCSPARDLRVAYTRLHVDATKMHACIA